MIDIQESNSKTPQINSYISEITFNSGESLSIKSNDIVIFVGPNNAGKTQTLNDIYTNCFRNFSTKVISNIKITKDNGSLIEFLKKISKVKEYENEYVFEYKGKRVSVNKNNGEFSFQQLTYYGDLTDAFVCKLSTENRLDICKPASIVDRDKSWIHPIYYAAYKTEYSEWLSYNFKKAFGKNITANSQHGSTIPLCIGPEVRLNDDYKSEIERINAFAEILESYDLVHLQGDGVKSFTGILLFLMLNYYRTYLIDEPESFLHPPQARILGQIIGKTLNSDQQAFISTHSEDFIKGLLDVCVDCLKIVRITRENDTNYFSILNNLYIKDVFGDSLLKYSNILSSLFYKTVVLCESDSDCKMYSVIDSYIKYKHGKYSEVLFIHCGGKQRMARTTMALKALNIDVKLITDFDVLNDESTIKGITDVLGIDWESIKSDYNIIVSNLHSSKEKINRDELISIIENILKSSKDKFLSQNEIKQIQDSVKTISKWDGLKHGGKYALPAGDATKAFDRLDVVFKNFNLYVVPVGELEGFVKEIGGHGPEWVNTVLEQYQDFNASIYRDIIEFIYSMNL